jgi:hypothetical protein
MLMRRIMTSTSTSTTPQRQRRANIGSIKVTEALGKVQRTGDISRQRGPAAKQQNS